MNGSDAIVTVVETAIYADDLDRAEAFYRDVLGLEVIGKEAGRHVFFRAGDRVLLVFRPEATLKGDILLAHGATGPGPLRPGHPPRGARRLAAPAGRARRRHRAGSRLAAGRPFALLPRPGGQRRRAGHARHLGPAGRLVGRAGRSDRPIPRDAHVRERAMRRSSPVQA